MVTSMIIVMINIMTSTTLGKSKVHPVHRSFCCPLPADQMLQPCRVPCKAEIIIIIIILLSAIFIMFIIIRCCLYR